MSMPDYEWLPRPSPSQESTARRTSRGIPIEMTVFAMVLVLTAIGLALGGS